MSHAEDAPKREYNATTWFVVLEQARRVEDHARAAEALEELRRLGVEVRFRPRLSEAASA